MPRNKKDDTRVIKCPLDKLLKPEVLTIVRNIVPIYNRITICATLFLNLHIRQLVESGAPSDEFVQFFQANKLVKYFMAVTSSTKGATDLHALFGNHFPSVTREYYTSTICPCCDSNVTRCTHIEQQRASPFFENGKLKDIRGLKHCPGCNTYFNRDNMGAWNIARNFTNMYQGMAPIRVRNAAQAAEQELTNRTEVD